jgi:L-iditol 2-dehydrogenase
VTFLADNLVPALHGIRDVRLEAREVPGLGDRDVLAEVRTVGVCSSDVHYYGHGRIGSFVVEEPVVLGHEVSGVVVARGAEATTHGFGQPVTLEPGVPCGRCVGCRSGRYNLCADVRFLATPPVDGAFAQHVAIHEDYAFALPDTLSDDAGALLEPLAVAIWACRKGARMCTGPGSRSRARGASTSTGSSTHALRSRTPTARSARPARTRRC